MKTLKLLIPTRKLRQGYHVYTYYLDGIPRYVGKGNRRRWIAHLNRMMDRSTHIERYLANNLPTADSLVIDVKDGFDERSAKLYEMCLIELYGRVDLGTGTLLNLTAGGDGLDSATAKRINTTPEARAKFSNAQKRLWADPVYRERMLAIRAKTNADPEYRKARAEGNRAALLRPGVREKQLATLAQTNKDPAVHARRSKAATIVNLNRYRKNSS